MWYRVRRKTTVTINTDSLYWITYIDVYSVCLYIHAYNTCACMSYSNLRILEPGYAKEHTRSITFVTTAYPLWYFHRYVINDQIDQNIKWTFRLCILYEQRWFIDFSPSCPFHRIAQSPLSVVVLETPRSLFQEAYPCLISCWVDNIWCGGYGISLERPGDKGTSA